MPLILNAALGLFNERGVGAVSTRAIAERAGISSGNLHYHFPNKEALVRALLEGRSRATDPLLSTPQDVMSLAAFERLLQQNLELAWQYRFLYREIVPISIQDPQFRELYVSVYQHRMQELRAVLESLVGAQVLDLTAEQFEVALMTGWIVSQNWVVHLEALGVEVTPERLADGARLVLAAVTAVCHTIETVLVENRDE